jgi:hypothetical protein
MTTLVVLETMALLLLAVLVAGLLRSHAEILRQLHHLGAGDAAQGVTSPVPLSRPGEHKASAIVGVSLSGDAVSVGVGRAGERTLLLFLSSGCSTCQRYWTALRNGAHRSLTGTRTVIVTRDADEESPAAVAGLGPDETDDTAIVMSSAAWDDYRVPGSPFAVVVESDGTIGGEGTAPGWDQLMSLVVQADGDIRERRADRELLAAGIPPGHPSLYPTPESG